MKWFVYVGGVLAALGAGGALLVACSSADEGRAEDPSKVRPWPTISPRERRFVAGLNRQCRDARALDIEGSIERTTLDGEDGQPLTVFSSTEAHVLRPMHGSVLLSADGSTTGRVGDGKSIFYLDHDMKTYRRTAPKSWREGLPELYFCRVWCDANDVDRIKDIRMEELPGRTRLELVYADRTETLELDEQQRPVTAHVAWNSGAAVRFEFTRFELHYRPDAAHYRSSIPEDYRVVE